MSVLEGFKAFNFNEGVPYVSVTCNGVTFNKAVVMKLNYPEYVVLFIDANSRRIALQVCDERTPNAVMFYRPKKKNVISVRWNGRDLLNTIKSMMQWDLEKESYRTEGELIQEENAMIFDLNNVSVLN
jgi:hypothetical protein